MPRISKRVRKPSQRALEAGFTAAPHSRVAKIKEQAKRKTPAKPRQPRAVAGKAKGKGAVKQRAGMLYKFQPSNLAFIEPKID